MEGAGEKTKEGYWTCLLPNQNCCQNITSQGTFLNWFICNNEKDSHYICMGTSYVTFLQIEQMLCKHLRKITNK